jgi:four helix bundle protein
MARIERFEEIEAWKSARSLTKSIYDLSSLGAFGKDFALRDQIRRAAMSVMANIAEGFERGGDKEFLQFLSVAKASCAEVRSHLYVALDQNYLSAQQLDDLIEQSQGVGRMISRFMDYLRNSNFRGNKFRPFTGRGSKRLATDEPG